MPTSSNVIYSEEKQVLLVKEEITYGVDSAPVAANAILVQNIQVSAMEGNVQERQNIKGFFGSSGSLRLETYCTVTFDRELAGSGTAITPPPGSILDLSCGHAEVIEADHVAYSVVETGIPPVSFYYYADGVLHKILGCFGKASLGLDSGGLPVKKYEFMGLFVTPGAATIPAGIDFSAFKIPLQSNKRNIKKVELFGHEIRMSQLSADLGQQVSYQNVAYAEAVAVTGRKTKLTTSFMEPDIAVINFWDLAEKNAYGAFDYQLGDEVTDEGYVFGFNAPNCQLTKCSRSYNNGQAYLNIEADVVPTSAGTDYTFFHR